MLILAATRLCAAIVATWGVPADRACPAALAIVTVAPDRADILAAIAWRESRFTPSAVNARTGCWGMYQVAGRRRSRDLYAQTRAAVAKLDESAAYCARRGDRRLLCALAGYASGPAGVRGRWYRGPRSVVREAVRVRRVFMLRASGVREQS